MRTGDRQRVELCGEEAGTGPHLVAVSAQPPALFGLAYVAAERVCHDLVPKADAEHRHLSRIRRAYEGAQRIEPEMVIIHPGGRAGDKYGFDVGKGGKFGSVMDGNRLVSEVVSRRSEHALKHWRIRPEPGAERGRHVAGLEDGELHGPIKWPASQRRASAPNRRSAAERSRR